MIYFLENKSRLFNQYMQNTLQLNGNGQFNEIANYAGVSKQIGVGVRCSLIWTMMVTRIFMFVTEYIRQQIKILLISSRMNLCKNGGFWQERTNQTIINRMQSTPILIMLLKTIKT
jgi:hypothetical protein